MTNLPQMAACLAPLLQNGTRLNHLSDIFLPSSIHTVLLGASCDPAVIDKSLVYSLARAQRSGSAVCVYTERAVTAATATRRDSSVKSERWPPRLGYQPPLLSDASTPRTGENFASVGCVLILIQNGNTG